MLRRAVLEVPVWNLKPVLRCKCNHAEPSFGFPKCLQRTKNCAARLTQWKSGYDARFQAVFETIRQMLETPVPAKKPIRFHARPQFPTKPAKPAKISVNNTN